MSFFRKIFGNKKDSFDLNQLAEIDLDEAVSKIKEKRKENQKAQKSTSKDVLGYFSVYAKAEKLEKEGKLEDAAIIYWKNIYENGSDAPANFKRLLIVLSKLKRKKEELSVALIFSSFVNGKEKDKIEKRIANIKKKLEIS